MALSVLSYTQGTDLGLANLEILVVAIDDGIFWAAGPDEADALRLEQTNWETVQLLDLLGWGFLEGPSLLLDTSLRQP